jgi:hypothetical protein
MYRYVFLPGALLMMLAIGISGFLLFDCFHRKFEMTWSPDKAYTGDVPSQRLLASCYMTGCPRVPLDRAFGCAWREIIVGGIANPPAGDSLAEHTACSHLSAFERKWVPDLETDIRNQMLRIRVSRSLPESAVTASNAIL